MKGRKARFALTLFLVLLVFGLGTKIVNAEGTEQDEDEVRIETEDALLSEFDFDEIEDSLRTMFPGEKLSFQDVLSSMISGDPGEIGKTFLSYLSDQVFYEFNYNRRNLVYVLLVSLTAAVFSSFAGAFRSRQISEISFYVMYMLLITLCLTSFQTASAGAEERLETLTEFMRVLCPSYFLAVAFASGSAAALFFYQVILLIIYAVELVIVRFLMPVINVYIMIQVLGNLTGEDVVSEFADLLKKVVTWILKTMLACVIGVNAVQGILAPAIDTLKRSALTRTAEALPWVGNAIGGAAEIVLGTAVLIKNGIGMAGAVIALCLFAVPVLQMLVMAFMYKLAAALVQPVSDKRITSCISGISEGYELMVRVIFTAGVLFLLTLAVVAASTS